MRAKNMLFAHLGFIGLITTPEFTKLLPAQQAVAARATAEIPKQTGTAIFYSNKLNGHRLTSGERYDKNALTAAHRTFAMGTMVKVTNLKNNKSVIVRINDRGPHGPKSEIIDVSHRAAQELGMVKEGRAKVAVEMVEAAKK